MEDYKSIEKILSADEQIVLRELMLHPGWGALKKVTKAIKEDWIEQTATFDMSSKTDVEMMRILRHRQGEIKGMSKVISYVEKRFANTKK